MILSQKYSKLQANSVILLSVKPKFANLIIEGSKHIELRRAIPAKTIERIAIYSSSPVQAIVALVDISETIEASPTKLWSIAKDNGAGLTRAEFMAYFDAKETGFAFMLENVRIYDEPIKPATIFKSFVPPQSFKYLSPNEIKKLEQLL